MSLLNLATFEDTNLVDSAQMQLYATITGDTDGIVNQGHSWETCFGGGNLYIYMHTVLQATVMLWCFILLYIM